EWGGSHAGSNWRGQGAPHAAGGCGAGSEGVMSMPMPTLVMLPPQTPTTRQWAKRLATAVPELSVIVAEDDAEAQQVIADAEAAYGTPTRAVLARAARLRWLQAPQAAPPAGWYFRELIEHPALVTNFRELDHDHI